MLEESLEKLPETQSSRNCTIIRCNYEQFDRDGVSMWRNDAVFVYSDADTNKIPIRVVGEINLSNQKLLPSQVDVVLKTLYQYRAQFGAPYPLVNLGGDNSPPTGEYVSANPPVTGKEFAWAMVNTHNWTIIFKEA